MAPGAPGGEQTGWGRNEPGGPDDGPGAIEATAFHPLPEETWTALASEAAGLTTFLTTRDPAPYRRYDHWWAKPLPATAETRVLPGA